MQFALDSIVSIVALGIFGQHIWALKGHFASDRMTGGARTISAGALLTCLIMLILVWRLDHPAAAQVAGVAIMLLSLSLFWAAVKASEAAKLRFAFDAALPRQLVTTGPYRRVRHPFYASYLIFWLGWAVATWSIWSLLPVAIMAALYTIAARYEETLLGKSAMASDYAAYRERAGLFWPRF
ncbi:S-isoprenylcysteine methyltransferase [Devosia limi DSM 17137]|uniref:Protein-S-isoprenylcysteine O-methyltransferase Ste14 n=1 Tax=Devosia limi DSM 17137 TaxID=1121477 RepID=A0A0F5LTR7_9HYPH|nr:isoprenylcysteine carboxylmethyltransferase family protein [Devosia limi]KKB85042.1 S-isoprenylcysteine methyltransferase [Devosia limi DSM 17137]SHF38595.1 Protein-S-isoprenylcysteine O-methyltransferase Ste14 [Devosia limi DSM 17137]